MVEPAISCRGLRKVYPGGVEAVRGLDFEVETGICFGLLGPNGAGKTTTVEILEGLLPCTAGEVRILGRSWNGGERELRRRLGITLQETRLSETLTVIETLRLFRSFYPRGPDPEELLRTVDLAAKATARVGRLSGGQRQRLAVATALAGDPEVLFLDEPTTGLDPASRRGLWAVILDAKARGTTIVLTTHAMEEAERLCDRVLIVDQGRLIALGTPEELVGALRGDQVVEMLFPGEEQARAAASLALPGVAGSRSLGRSVEFLVAGGTPALSPLLEALAARGLDLLAVHSRRTNLEDAFVRLTGHSLRHEDPAPAD
jgi:ABC-2 type transport system ATP-binding protein